MTDSVESKIERIKAEIERKNKEAESLLQYLSVQQQIAKEEEEKDEDELKKQGVLVGQHIPSLPSRLDLDPSEVSKYETFGGTLLIAKDLVQQNRTNFLRRTGNLPISELAEQRRDENAKYLAQQDPDVPHYQNMTKTAELREERVNVRFADTLQDTVKVKKQKEIAETGGKIVKEKKPKIERPKVISMKEKLQHENVLNSINHKLNYLRNPRNDPKAVNKMLTKTKGEVQHPSPNGSAASPDKGDAVSHLGSIAESMESGVRESIGGGAGAGASVSVGSGKTNKFSRKPAPIKDNPLFVCEPKIVLFQDYDIGNKYHRTLTFRNVSAVSRTVRILQPKSNIMQISPLKYPPNCPNGVIAPGMSVSCTLTFTPTELGDITDFIRVETESGFTGVQITAQREPPNLSIPSIINLGYCLVGDSQRSSLQCTNTGGTGRFEVLASTDDECIEGKSLRIPPFTVYPTQFELGKGEHVDLVFEYVPLKLGQVSRSFIIRCDNGQVRDFTVSAKAKEIQMTYSEVNTVAFDSQGRTDMFKDLIFSHIPVGSETTQSVTVINDTGIPMEYEWVWIDTKVKDKNIHSEGQKLIAKRMEEQRPLTVMDSKPATAQLSETQGHLQGADLENSIANHSLLRSIRENLEGGSESNSHMSENSAKHDAFEILPARGVIAGEGAGEFKIVYAPRHATDISMRAVMMIKGVPFPALPGDDQPGALQRLESDGHGDFVRFKSWLEELATVGTVDKYKKPNGAYSTEKGLVSLATVIALVANYAVSEPTVNVDDEIVRVDSWVRKMMKHFYDFRKTSAVLDDDQTLDAQSSVEEGAKQEIIFMYDWESDSGDKPSLAAPITLFFRSPKQSNDDDNQEDNEFNEGENDGDDSSVEGDRLSTKDQWLVFSDDEQEVMKIMWLDANNIVKLLGDTIANLLNEKVQHEAVEYLKDCSLNNYAGIQFSVHGHVEPHRIMVRPPCVEVGGALSVGADYHGSVDISNTSLAPMELELSLDEMVVKRLSQTHIDDIFEEMREVASEIDGGANESLADVVNIHLDNPRVLLMPQTSTKIDFIMTVHALGRYAISIPIKASDSSVHTENIVVHVLASCPQIRFDTAEIDLGLLGVGQENVANLTFVNEGDVPAMFMMKPTIHLDNMAGGKKLGSVAMSSNTPGGGVSGSNTARSQQGGVPLSGRSTLSRASSIHSDDFSVADSQATTGTTDFKIDIKNAIVTVEPNNGVVEPGKSMTVQVRGKAGKLPQRIRGMIETRVFDATGKTEAHKQFLNLRGEVQAPKVLLYPMQHSLGQVFVGRPVSFSFTLENICNLPTKFKFQRPGGTSSMYSYTLTPAKGSLEAKEKLVVQGVFTALTPGVIDDCLACKMFGISLPLGLGLKAVAKGIQLEFLSLSESEVLPEPIAPMDCVQYPHGDKAPDPRPTMPINLGEAVPLYKRRYGRLVIRNLSAIPAPIELKVKRFMIIEKPKRFTASQSVDSQSVTSSIGAKERDDLVLGPREDGTNRFQSQAGKDYIGAELHRREDRKFLQSGLGASYFLENGQDIIPPWGVHEVIVHAFNDIPGVYDDEIEVFLQEGEIQRKMAVPLIMRVDGCPIIIEKSTLGITVVDRAYKGPPEWFGKQLLQLGQACEHTSEPLHREFYVRNCGSKPGVIKWTVRGIATKAYGPIKVSLQVDPSGKVKTKYRFWDDIAKESPFQIEPNMAILPAYGREKFHVKLIQAAPAEIQRANLSAQIVVQEDDGSIASLLAGPVRSRQSILQNNTAGPDGSRSGSSSSSLVIPTGAQVFSLDLFVEGSLVHPQLVVDKHTYSISEQDTVAHDHQALKLKAKATLLFASAGKPSDICYRLVEITNPLETSVVISASIDGPYVIKDVPAMTNKTAAGGVERSSSAPGKGSKLRTGGIASKHVGGSGSPERAVSPTASQARPQSPTASLAGSSTAVSMGSFGRMLQLLPHQSTKFMVAFQPKRSLREQIIASFGGDAGKPTEARGDLIFSYPTGQKLHIPLITTISTPFITGSAPRLYFGICHVREKCQALYLISNPTDVPARWTVTHIPNGGAWKPASAIRVKGFEQVPEVDDPDVFHLTPNAGSVEGPTVSVAATMAAPPKDYNRKALEESVVPERLVQASWATQTLTIKDAVDLKHQSQHQSEADACFPMPITVLFTPKKNVRYCSRFRFSCEFANSFDLVLQGEGTFEEHEHRPLNPIPR